MDCLRIITNRVANEPHSLWTTRENNTKFFTKGTNSLHHLNANTNLISPYLHIVLLLTFCIDMYVVTPNYWNLLIFKKIICNCNFNFNVSEWPKEDHIVVETCSRVANLKNVISGRVDSELCSPCTVFVPREQPFIFRMICWFYGYSTTFLNFTDLKALNYWRLKLESFSKEAILAHSQVHFPAYSYKPNEPQMPLVTRHSVTLWRKMWIMVQRITM